MRGARRNQQARVGSQSAAHMLVQTQNFILTSNRNIFLPHYKYSHYSQAHIAASPGHSERDKAQRGRRDLSTSHSIAESPGRSPKGECALSLSSSLGTSSCTVSLKRPQWYKASHLFIRTGASITLISTQLAVSSVVPSMRIAKA